MDTRLKSITLEGFRSFSDRTTISFPEKGLFNLKGVNHDSGGGSSGSGKSSLILGISYALGYCPFPATELRSWDTEAMNVHLDLDAGGKKVAICRGDRNSLQVDLSRAVTASSRIQEKLNEITGLSPELLAALTYRGQKKPGLFLSKTDSEKKEFLSSLLGLDKIEEAVESSKETIKKLEAELEILRVNLASLKIVSEPVKPVLQEGENLEQLEHTIQSLEKNIASLKRGHIESIAKLDLEIGSQIETLNLKLAEARRETFVSQVTPDYIRLSKTLEEAKERVRRALEAESDKQDKQRQTLASLNATLNGIKNAESRILRNSKEIEKIRSEIKKLNEQVCPTCDQFWMKAKDQSKLLEAKILVLTNEIEFDQEIVDSRADTEAGIEAASKPIVQDPMIAKLLSLQMNLQAQVAAEQQKMASGNELFIAQKNARVADLQNQINALKENYSAEEGLYLVSLQQMQEGLDKLQKRRHIASEVARANEAEAIRWEYNFAEWTRKQDELNALRYKIAEKEKKVNEEEDFVGLIGREGFLGSIFDEILNEISNETNKLLAVVPNVSHVTLKFRSESFTQKGTVKRTIVPVVNVNGNEVHWQAGLSGGMATSLEFAVDLAVSTVIGRRTGHSPKWLILDEIFEGLGTTEKEVCLTILKKHAEDKLVIVVDHMSEFQELFPNSITIHYQNGKSRVE